MDSPDPSCASSSSGVSHNSLTIRQLKKAQMKERESLVLTKRPFLTLKYFMLATLRHLWKLWIYTSTHRAILFAVTLLCTFIYIVLFLVAGPHDKFVKESLAYSRYILWWVGLGVASSIGLGSGLHTFVLYLGPHIALFTFKAILCGREDLKMAPYDTAQFGIGPSWVDRNCTSIGPPKYPSFASENEEYRVPLLHVLLQVQPEAILWGIGTALGELPPYFVSKAARLSGERLKELDDLFTGEEDSSSSSSEYLKRIKQWMLSHVQHLGFFTILIFASVPNPLFDLAGIMCGQFLVPFWKFFTATLIGKALIKTHIQTVFIILACNPHLVGLIEHGLGWLMHHVPSLSFVVPRILSALESAKEGFRQPKQPGHSKFSVTFVWNTVVLLMLAGFLGSIINSTAQGYLLERQNSELAAIQAGDEPGSN